MKNITKIKDYLFLLINLVLVFIILNFIFYNVSKENIISLFNSGNYISDGDYFYQFVPFYQEFYSLIQKGNLSWSWNLFFGNNFFASKSYYLIGDIYAWIGYLFFQNKEAITTILFKLYIFKLTVSAITSYFLFSKLKINHYLRVIYSLAYVFCGFNSMFVEVPIFISYYSFAPLIFIGIEDIINHKKFNNFIIGSFLLLITNYYLSFTSFVFILIYYIFRFFIVKNNFFDFIKTGFLTLFNFIISLFLSSFIWLPSLLFLLNSPRLSVKPLMEFNFWTINDSLRILSNFLMPLNYSLDSVFSNYWYFFNQIGIYFSLIGLSGLGLIFTLKNLKNKLLYLILVLISCLSLISPIVGKMLLFTYTLRYTINITLILLIVSSLVFNEFLTINLKRNIVYIIGFLVVLLGVYYFIKINIVQDFYLEEKVFKLIPYFLIGYALIMSILSFNFKFKSIFLLILLTILTFELINFNISPFNTQMLKNKIVIDDKFLAAYQKLKQYDNSFYRIDTEVIGVNQNVYYQIPSTFTYDSTYQYSMYPFLETMRMYPNVDWRFSFNDFGYTLGNPFLGIKYAIVKDESKFETYDWYGIEIKELETPPYRIYKFKDPGAMAKTIKKVTLIENQFKELNKDNFSMPKHEVIKIMRDEVGVGEKIYQKFKDYNNDDIQYFDGYETVNSMSFNIDLTKNSLVTFAIPYDEGFTILDNDKEIEGYKAYGSFYLLDLSEGSHNIVFIHNYTHLNKAFKMMVVGAILLLIKFIIYIFKKIKKRFYV